MSVQTHILKTRPVYFDAVKSGDKNFEVRRDDRGFQKGDVLVLRRTLPDRPDLVEYGLGAKVAHEITRQIAYVLTGGQFGIEPGYVVLGLAPTPQEGGKP